MNMIRWPFGRAPSAKSNTTTSSPIGAPVPQSIRRLRQIHNSPNRPRMFACDLGSDMPVAVISRRPENLSQEIEWLRDQSVPVLVVQSLENIIRQGFGARCAFAMLLVDIDTLGDLEDVTVQLARLRRDNPELPVIMVSSGFGRDDFGITRLQVADVSLRWPVSFFRLEIAISQAHANNLEWQSRLDMIA